MNTREALAHAILDAIRDSVSEYDTPHVDRSSLEWTGIDGRVDMLAAVDALLATYLVIPRSDIVGTEYGWRASPDGNVRPRPSRDAAFEAVAHVRASGGVWAHSEAVQHPVLPWSVIPLPKDGDINA
jgi:hypothetical protein